MEMMEQTMADMSLVREMLDLMRKKSMMKMSLNFQTIGRSQMLGISVKILMLHSVQMTRSLISRDLIHKKSRFNCQAKRNHCN